MDKDLKKLLLGLGGVAIIAVLAIFFMWVFRNSTKKINTRFIGRTAIFAAMATVLYVVPIFQFKVPFFPAFLEIHFDEVPAAIAAFAYGPLSGFLIILIKTIIKLPMTSSLCVGEFADLLYGSMLILPGAFIYRKMHNFKGVAIGLSIGFVTQVVVAAFFTTFVLVPFYSNVMGLPFEAILEMCNKANGNIVAENFNWLFFLFVGLPFNAFKNVIIVALTLMLYKALHKLIDKIAFKTAMERQADKEAKLAGAHVDEASVKADEADQNKD